MSRFIVTHPSSVFSVVDADTQAEALAIARARGAWQPSDPPTIDPNELDAEPLDDDQTPHTVERTTTETITVWASSPDEAILMAQHFDTTTWQRDATLSACDWRAEPA